MAFIDTFLSVIIVITFLLLIYSGFRKQTVKETLLEIKELLAKFLDSLDEKEIQ
jgi:hypothetical protein